MRLGLTLSHIAKPILPYRYRGKNRTVKKPSMHHLFKMKQDFEREERNMLILRHPYLTVEQSFGHKTEDMNRKCNTYLPKCKELYIQKFSKQITIADRLSHMRVTEAWD